jgi:hypothetical protein
MVGSSLLAECSLCFGSTTKEKSRQRMWHSGQDRATTAFILLINNAYFVEQEKGRELKKGLLLREYDILMSRQLIDVLLTAANAVARKARRQQVRRQNGCFGVQIGGWLNKMAHFPSVFIRADAEQISVFMHGALVLQCYFGVHHHNMDLPHQK